MKCWRGTGAAFLACSAVVALQAQTYTVLTSFDGTNGKEPQASLVQGIDGNLYGTTAFGGKHNCPSGCGTIFKITPGGTLTTIYRFSGADGASPHGALIQATDGCLYGTTEAGGANCGSRGCGTVFKMTPEGTLMTLHRFDGADGSDVVAGLVEGFNGDFYGATGQGGPNNGFGTIFRITPGGALKTLHTFSSSGPNGELPFGGLVQGVYGAFFGTTDGGGANSLGTVFKITQAGALTTLHSFDRTDGCCPYAGLMLAANGSFYGVTNEGGTKPQADGTVFEIAPDGALTTVHNFGGPDGANPLGVLMQATDDNIYGTTSAGGAYLKGTVFAIMPGAKLRTIHSFDGPDGNLPIAGLVQGTDGSFYGSTIQGGANGAGIVFRLSVGLGPFVRTLTTSGKVGSTVIILGTDLTGSTGVSFNGTAATFTIVSATEITATVPVGATTGMIEVTTPGGTLSSNVVFRVTP